MKFMHSSLACITLLSLCTVGTSHAMDPKDANHLTNQERNTRRTVELFKNSENPALRDIAHAAAQLLASLEAYKNHTTRCADKETQENTTAERIASQCELAQDMVVVEAEPATAQPAESTSTKNSSWFWPFANASVKQ